MTSREDANGATNPSIERDVDDAFEELAQRAGAALRNPAPANGVGEIARRSRRERIIKTGAIGGVALLVVAGGIVMLDESGEPDTLVPTERITVDSSVPTLPVLQIETTLPPATVSTSTLATVSTTDPLTTSTELAMNASPPVTSVTVPWTPVGTKETSTQLLEQTVTPSSIGDLHWTVLESAFGDGFGSHMYPVRGPRGFMTVRAGELIISADAVSWQRVTASFPGTPVYLYDTYNGRFELAVRADNGSTQFWQSSDLEAWSLARDESVIAAFADRIVGPGLVNEVWSPPFRTQVPVLPDGKMLIGVAVGLDIRGQIAARVADDEFRQALDDGRPSEIWWEQSDSDALSGIARVELVQDRSGGESAEAKEGSSGTFEVELSISGMPDDWAVEVRNPSNGESLGVVRGSISAGDLGSTLEAMMHGRFHEWFLVDGDTTELVRPDWADATGTNLNSYATTDNGLLVLVTDLAAGGPPKVWRSADGRTWEQLAVAGWIEAAPSWAQMSPIYQAPDGGFMAMFSGGRGEVAFLTSADGVNWQPAEQPPVLRSVREGSGYDPLVHETSRGFVLTALPWGEDEHFAEVWTSTNGHVWEPVEADEIIIGNAGDMIHTGTSRAGQTSGLVVITRPYEGGREIDWLIDVS